MYGQPNYLGYGLAKSHYGEHGDDLFTHDEYISMGIEPQSPSPEYQQVAQSAEDSLAEFFPAQSSVSVDEPAGMSVAQQYTTTRSGKTLPFISGGATDAGVEKQLGIKGLVSYIQMKMGVPVTGKITTKQIEDYQTSQNIGVDGTIGKDTYTKLGIEPPYPKSKSKSGGVYKYDPKTDVAIGKTPWYKSKPFLYGVTGVAFAVTAYLIFAPRGD